MESRVSINPTTQEKVFSYTMVLNPTDEEIQAVTQFITANIEIKSAIFQFSKLMNAEIAKIIAITLVHTLDFTYSDVRDGEDIEQIASAIQANTTLRNLNLPALPGECMPVLSKVLATHPSLKSLSVEFYGDGEERVMCATAIAAMINANTHLQVLTIKGNLIDDEAAAIIACALANNKVLEEIKFPNLRILKLPDLDQLRSLNATPLMSTFIQALVISTNLRKVGLKLSMSPTLEVDKADSFSCLLMASKCITQFTTSNIIGITPTAFRNIKNHVDRNKHELKPIQEAHMTFKNQSSTSSSSKSSYTPTTTTHKLR